MDNTNKNLIYISSSTCMPCKIIKPIIDKIIDENDYVIEKIIADESEEKRNYAYSLNVKSVPTLIFYKNGEEINRKTGNISEQEIREYLKNTI